MAYQDLIREDLAAIGEVGVSPRFVEAWMRVQHDTLDSLSPRMFRREVKIAAACVHASTDEKNEALAMSIIGPRGEQEGK